MDMPQRMAAVPAYLPSHSAAAFGDAAPGHKFLGYFRNTQGAGGEAFAAYKGKAKVARHVPSGPEKRAANDRLKQEFDGVLNEVCGLPASSKAQIQAIRSRQQALHAHHGASGYRISTTSTAPFATGLGNEHPIENGFAFLTPYGLPYLAGSGVKGILRRAAQELALENESQQPDGWTWLAIWWLFGFEGAVDKGSLWDGDSPMGHAFRRDLAHTAANPDLLPLIRQMFAGAREGARFLDVEQNGPEQFLHACLAGKSLRGGLQYRGTIDFWDVFPNPAGGRLEVEIMTPHFGKYYQGNDTPHDSGQPVPVSFLAVPAKSDFDFHVVCHSSRLPAQLQNQWRSLLDQAFEHAFEWVGFGAKTSVGYGAMNAAKAMQPFGNAHTNGAATSSHAIATMATTAGGMSSGTQVWPAAKLTLNPSTGAVTGEFGGLKTTPLAKPGADMLRAELSEELANKLKKNKEIKNVAVVVEPLGNGWQLKGLAPA